MEEATKRIPLKPSTTAKLQQMKQFAETWDELILRLLAERRNANGTTEMASVSEMQRASEHD